MFLGWIALNTDAEEVIQSYINGDSIITATGGRERARCLCPVIISKMRRPRVSRAAKRMHCSAVKTNCFRTLKESRRWCWSGLPAPLGPVAYRSAASAAVAVQKKHCGRAWNGRYSE